MIPILQFGMSLANQYCFEFYGVIVIVGVSVADGVSVGVSEGKIIVLVAVTERSVAGTGVVGVGVSV